jgi:hypothetical protein
MISELNIDSLLDFPDKEGEKNISIGSGIDIKRGLRGVTAVGADVNVIESNVVHISCPKNKKVILGDYSLVVTHDYIQLSNDLFLQKNATCSMCRKGCTGFATTENAPTICWNCILFKINPNNIFPNPNTSTELLSPEHKKEIDGPSIREHILQTYSPFLGSGRGEK